MLAEPLDAADSLVNAGDISGRVVVIMRGACTFVQKAIKAEAAGACGVIFVNRTEKKVNAFSSGNHVGGGWGIREWRNCCRTHTQDPSTKQLCLQVNVKRTEKEQRDYERGLSVEISVPCVCVGLTDGQRIMRSFVGFKAEICYSRQQLKKSGVVEGCTPGPLTTAVHSTP